MRMNRRNVLVGLGTIVAGGGAALGTGAFSSVEAERTVTVNLESDADALLELSVNDQNFEGVTGDTSSNSIEINFNDINDNAISAFHDVIAVNFSESNTENESFEVAISTSHGGVAVYDTGFESASGEQNSATLGTLDDTTEVSAGVAINTGVENDDRFGDEVLSDGDDANITITATRN